MSPVRRRRRKKKKEEEEEEKLREEKWKKKKDAGEIIAEAERKMEAAAGSDGSAADASAGERWREKMREQLRASGAENMHAAIHQDPHDEL